MVEADRAVRLGVPGDALVVGPPRGLEHALCDAELARDGERLEQPRVRRVGARMTPADDHEPGVRDALERAREPAHRRRAVEPRVDASVPEHERRILGHEHAAADPRGGLPGRLGGHAERDLEQRRIGVRRRVQAPRGRQQPERVEPLRVVRDQEEVAPPHSSTVRARNPGNMPGSSLSAIASMMPGA